MEKSNKANRILMPTIYTDEDYLYALKIEQENAKTEKNSFNKKMLFPTVE